MRPGPILVAGATGTQGSAVVRHLMAEGWIVRALTRDPTSPRAVAMAEEGVEVYRGDFSEPLSLDYAMAGAYGAFSVLPSAVTGTDREVDYGTTFADAAERAGVRHFIYASIGGVERASRLPQFKGKVQIEEHIHQLGLPTTVLRSAFLMDNLLTPGMRGAVIWGAMAGALGRALPMQMIAADDIGALAALAFAEPDRFLGYAVEIAGDEVTVDRAKQVYRKVTGRGRRFVPLPFTVLRWFDSDVARLFEWIRADGFQADLGALQQLHPGLKDLERGLRDAVRRRRNG